MGSISEHYFDFDFVSGWMDCSIAGRLDTLRYIHIQRLINNEWPRGLVFVVGGGEGK